MSNAFILFIVVTYCIIVVVVFAFRFYLVTLTASCTLPIIVRRTIVFSKYIM